MNDKIKQIYFQLQDLPNVKLRANTDKYKLKSFKREDEFELMLTAIEENSGHMIILARVEWGKTLRLQYDCKRSIHERLELTELKTYCKFRDGQFILLLGFCWIF